MPLETYRHKRNFERTPEPQGDAVRGPGGKRALQQRLQFVVQKHAARRLHYDFRLELDGTLKSWAVPKGPSLDPRQRRLAVHTEDHPLEYATFEGVIPAGEYGGGAVLVWDRGYWVPEAPDPARALADGKLDFRLQGEKLRGRWTLVRLNRKDNSKEQWLLIKRHDREAREPDSAELAETRPESVLTGRDLEAIARAQDRVWHSNGGEGDAPVTAAVGDPSTVRGAKREPMPKDVRPQLATRVETVPEGEDWFHEPKLDGYRLLCGKSGKKVTLHTRRGNDWTSSFPTIAEAVEQLPCSQVLLDGEAVFLNPKGLSDFQSLQNTIGRRDPHIVLVAFDLLYLDGWNLCGASLRRRKELLRLLLHDAPPAVRYGDHLSGRGAGFFREACATGLEGIVSKRADAPYRQGRSTSWLKIKCQQREELVVVGFTEPKGSRVGLGALLLGTRSAADEPLRYAGKVGTGFSDRSLAELRKQLNALRRPTPAVTDAPKRMRDVHWVEPRLVAEVSFTEWTQEGRVRQPVFHGLREDKPSEEVVQERVASAAEITRESASTSQSRSKSSRGRRTAKSSGAVVAGVSLTNPNKVLFPEQGITKLQLAQYYERVASHMLPHVRGRPLTLLRCPNGHHDSCFYQKHITTGVPEAIGRVEVKPDEDPYAVVEDLPGLIGLVQLGVLEIHVWGSRVPKLDQPDIVVFDLDPDEGLGWGRVVEAAQQLRVRLQQLNLESFVRLTGGKGLHVVVPIVAGPSWAHVKEFSRALALYMVEDQPERFTAKITKSRREGKIFIDYLRNARESTAIASYSVRAKSGAPVALPVEWEALDRQGDEPPRFGVLEVPDLIARRERDPWAQFEAARGKLPGS